MPLEFPQKFLEDLSDDAQMDAKSHEPQFEHWTNPTNDTVRVAVWHHPPVVSVDPKGRRAPQIVKGREIYEFAPGETKQIPKEDAKAFHDYVYDKAGNATIVGGLAPQLRKLGGKKVSIDKALDTNATLAKEATKKAQELLASQAVSQNAIMALEAQRLEAARLAAEEEARMKAVEEAANLKAAEEKLESKETADKLKKLDSFVKSKKD